MDIKTTLLTANKAISEGKYAGFLLYCTDNTKWDFVGERTLEGKSAILQHMEETYLEPPIFHIERLRVSGVFLCIYRSMLRYMDDALTSPQKAVERL